MAAYEDMIRSTAGRRAVVRRARGQQVVHPVVVAGAIVDALDRLDLRYPLVRGSARRDLKLAAKALRAED